VPVGPERATAGPVDLGIDERGARLTARLPRRLLDRRSLTYDRRVPTSIRSHPSGSSAAVIFDMDGVLVDSEVISAQVEAELLAQYGATITVEEIYAHFVGLSKASMTEALRRDWKLELPEEFWSTRSAQVATRFAAEGQAVAGIVPVLEGLAGLGVPLAVASSSSPGSIARKLTITGLDRYFDGHLYSATMVPDGKPAPDLFLHAAAQLGVRPGDCVVVEDAVPGVLAGVAAGMRVIGFAAAGHCAPGHAEVLHDAGAHAVAFTADELTALLADLFAAELSGTADPPTPATDPAVGSE
jgi:HAD superfamily hydrolase (TIGR01509 family)